MELKTFYSVDTACIRSNVCRFLIANTLRSSKIDLLMPLSWKPILSIKPGFSQVMNSNDSSHRV